MWRWVEGRGGERREWRGVRVGTLVKGGLREEERGRGRVDIAKRKKDAERWGPMKRVQGRVEGKGDKRTAMVI